jgi:hypothetical protein
MCLRLWRRILHERSNEAIPWSSKRLNEDGRLSRFAERITQPFDSGIQTMIEVDEGARRPELAAQFLSGNQFSRSFKQRRQNLQYVTVIPNDGTKQGMVNECDGDLSTVTQFRDLLPYGIIYCGEFRL